MKVGSGEGEHQVEVCEDEKHAAMLPQGEALATEQQSAAPDTLTPEMQLPQTCKECENEKDEVKSEDKERKAAEKEEIVF